jgi:hypothetical protein
VDFVPMANRNAKLKTVKVQSWQDFVEEMDKEYDKNEKQYIYTTLYNLYMQSEVGLDVTEKLGDLVFDIESMRDQNDVLQEMLPAVIIKQQRILPGKSYSGILICDTGDLDAAIEGSFRISVAVEEEEHRFVFKRDLSD